MYNFHGAFGNGSKLVFLGRGWDGMELGMVGGGDLLTDTISGSSAGKLLLTILYFRI